MVIFYLWKDNTYAQLIHTIALWLLRWDPHLPSFSSLNCSFKKYIIVVLSPYFPSIPSNSGVSFNMDLIQHDGAQKSGYNIFYEPRYT
jgi:hypothetical protein